MLLILSLFSGCNDAGFAVASINPIYGWTDGCNAVRIGGHGFDADVAATVGGNAVGSVALPTDDLNKGFFLDGVMPAGSKGYAEVVVTSGGETSRLTGTAGYYYVECPAAGTIDSVSPQTDITSGAVLTVAGCGLDAATITARFVDAAGTTVADAVPLSSSCGKGTVTLSAPALADGSYYLELVETSTGTVLAGTPCAPADSADTGSSCTDYVLTWGTAQ